MRKSCCFFVVLAVIYIFIFTSHSHACFSDGRDQAYFREVFWGKFELPEDFSFDFSPILGENREISRAFLRFTIVNPERQPGNFSLLADDDIFRTEELPNWRQQSFRLNLFDLAPEALSEGRVKLKFFGPEDFFLRRVVLNVRTINAPESSQSVPLPPTIWLFGSGLLATAVAPKIRRQNK